MFNETAFNTATPGAASDWSAPDAPASYSPAGYSEYTFFGVPVAPTTTGTDFLGALRSYWESSDIAASLPTLHYDSAAGDELPYAVLSQIAGKTGGRTGTKGYWEDKHLQFAIYATSQDQAVTLGKAAAAVLDALTDTPLTFDDGEQTFFLRSGDSLLKLPTTGRNGVAMVWQQRLTYHCRLARTRS